MSRRLALLLPLTALLAAGCGDDPAGPGGELELAVDLVADPLTVPASASVGGLVEYEVPFSNAGNERAEDGWYVRVYLSADAALDGGDVLIDQFTARNELGPGGSDSYLRSFKVPGDVAPGDYYLVSELDATGVYEEHLEDNNTAASTAQLRILPGDA